jgi:hypothetical protein
MSVFDIDPNHSILHKKCHWNFENMQRNGKMEHINNVWLILTNLHAVGHHCYWRKQALTKDASAMKDRWICEKVTKKEHHFPMISFIPWFRHSLSLKVTQVL